MLTLTYESRQTSRDFPRDLRIKHPTRMGDEKLKNTTKIVREKRNVSMTAFRPVFLSLDHLLSSIETMTTTRNDYWFYPYSLTDH
jgi:hypothetical protein